MRKFLTLTAISLLVAGCAAPSVEKSSEESSEATAATPNFPTVGSISTTRPDLINPNTPIYNLGGNYIWSEGPVWVSKMDAVLYTDVPGNTIWKYKQGEGITEWMSPSGSVPPLADYTSSPGANGLIMFDDDHIVVPDHGNRALYKLNLETQEKTVLADSYKGKRLNSPNDAVLHSSGIIFFTDPPYGLKGKEDDPARELDFNGVYALMPSGELRVIEDSMTRPNGIILSPDERTLYVANALPSDRYWMAYDMSSTGEISNGRILARANSSPEAVNEGNPDGMAIAADGTLFATGPGGVIMFSPEGERLGLISTGSRIANVTFGGEDGRDLYMTSHTFLAHTRTEVKGHGF